mgnify:CR=1 FL=1
MKNAIKNIVPIILIMSILLSTFSITLYTHHCNYEGKTTFSINKVAKCDHQKQNIKCSCNSSECSLNTVSTQNNSNHQNQLSLKDECCSFSAQDTTLPQASLWNDIQKSIYNSKIYRNTVEYISNTSIYNYFESQVKEIDNKIIQPINKFILLIHKITSYKNSDKEDSNS